MVSLINYFISERWFIQKSTSLIKLFIYGGTIRDLYGKVEIKDIDCLYVGNYKEIYKLFYGNSYRDTKILPKKREDNLSKI